MSSRSSSSTASPTSDAEKSRNDRAMKKKEQKQIRPTFSDPDAFVTFLIGPDEKKFIVHKEFACNYSPILKAAFNSQFIEGQTQTYRLEDTTEGTVRLFVQWLYYQQLEILQLQDDDVDDDLAIDEDKSLFGVWILADKLGAPHLQNLAIESIKKINRKTQGLATMHLHYIYDNTSAGSLLRRYMVDQCRNYLLPESYTECPHYFPHEFLIELAASHPVQDDVDEIEMGLFCGLEMLNRSEKDG